MRNRRCYILPTVSLTVLGWSHELLWFNKASSHLQVTSNDTRRNLVLAFKLDQSFILSCLAEFGAFHLQGILYSEIFFSAAIDVANEATNTCLLLRARTVMMAMVKKKHLYLSQLLLSSWLSLNIIFVVANYTVTSPLLLPNVSLCGTEAKIHY